MDFSTLLKTQKQVVKLLENSLTKNRLVSIYLFDGAKGTPKREAGYYFASLVMCEDENKPCYNCLSCKRILNGKHPRIYEIYPNPKGNIGKAQIDDLEHEFSLVGLEEGKRVFIINDVDRLTNEAANRLLKFLEETKEGIYGILITDSLSSIIPTIRSRAQIVSFTKVSNEVNSEIYKSKGINEEIANILPLITNNIDEGLSLINDGKIIDIIDLVKKINYSLVSNKTDPLVEFVLNRKFILNEKDKRYHEIFLDLLVTISNDRLYKKLKQLDKVIFTSVDIVDECEIDEVFRIIEIILKFKERIKYNVNLELLYIQLLTEIAR